MTEDYKELPYIDNIPLNEVPWEKGNNLYSIVENSLEDLMMMIMQGGGFRVVYGKITFEGMWGGRPETP